MNLEVIDNEIHNCSLCTEMVEKFKSSKTVSIGKNNDIVILGDAATKTILDIKYKKFSDVVGKRYDIDGMTIIPIYHPSPISPKSYSGNIDIFNELKDIVNDNVRVLIKKVKNANY